ncbi:hypothetical protein [Clostridium sp. 3-3]|uniref:hypothetical protein n=1 Tax=Clostridium sp. 3-3 TaxID=2070757 RepID=UPI000CDA7AA6|nr:hypothetical protein [Clostridium sp. 3-3]POO87872.1 hypothetical protein C1H59_03655 [Clostridium sp. 3-3]
MLKELGKYKLIFLSLLKNSDTICKLVLGEDYEDGDYDLDKELEKYLIPHLFVPDTIKETQSYALFDVGMYRGGSSIKTMRLIVQTFCHKKIISYPEKPKGYYGYRYDVLAQCVEELLYEDKDNGRKFGIGIPELVSVNGFLINDYVGHVLTFDIKAFR